MKWFKHMSNANKDDKIISLRSRFGMWGIGVYWTLVELVAEQIKEDASRANASFVVSEMIANFRINKRKLIEYLTYAQHISLLDYEQKENIIHIEISKLLDFADNYIKYDGKSLKTLQRQNKMSTKHRIDKNRIDKNIHTCVFDFDSLWTLYPKRLGKKAAIKHFNASVKTEEDWNNINKALQNYIAHLKSKNIDMQYTQHGSTWFNNWQDWIEVNHKPEKKSSLAIAMEKGQA
ncbi:MAG: DUF4373 domain-containing protein [Candidatus Rickettsiella isopodorum]|nr:DUF4373 domain-containing protein [Candidatus Rickettsiella isopodorum]